MIRKNGFGKFAVIAACRLSVAGVSALAAEWSWQQPHATVMPNGDLAWAPEPFAYTPGASVRYIDFADGNDNNDGLSKDKPWKHHPWDPQAGGKARECTTIQTYVFKRGVIYRGALRANQSGEPAARGLRAISARTSPSTTAASSTPAHVRAS